MLHFATASIVIAIMLQGVASAQEDRRAVESGIADRGPLSTSLRQLSTDLRLPTNFERVYRVPGLPGIPGYSGQGEYYMRSSGALHAVFPRSVYQRFRNRRSVYTLPVIPDGTVFYIGAPTFSSPPQSVQPAPADKRRLKLRRDGLDVIENSSRKPSIYPKKLHPAPGRPQTQATVSPKIVADASYRATRLHALMRQAARAANTDSG